MSLRLVNLLKVIGHIKIGGDMMFSQHRTASYFV